VTLPDNMDRMWPRPRVGQKVKLRNGKVAEVIQVRAARDVLKSLNEVQAILARSKMSASLGTHWLDIYYEADVTIRGTAMSIKTISTMDVVEVMKSDID
jgi:hypothetical protein